MIKFQHWVYYINYFEGSVILYLYGVFCIFGIIMNSIVLFAFIRTAHLRNIRNSFIVNLACSDLFLCAVTAPSTLYQRVLIFWPFGDVSCRLVSSVQAVNTFVSSLTLVLISVDRVLLTLCPVSWRLASTAPILCYVAVWIASIAVSIPYALAVKTQNAPLKPWIDRDVPAQLQICERSMPQVCAEDQFSSFVSTRSYSMIVLAIQYLLPLFALAFAYFHIGAKIHRRTSRALLLLFLLVLTYAICWAPVNLYHILNSFGLITYSHIQFLFCHLVGISSACFNPIIYAMVNESFRSALQQMSLSFCPTQTRSPYSPTNGGQTTRKETLANGTLNLTPNIKDTSSYKDLSYSNIDNL
ncbi:hypothetical protein WR25_09647 [Diploscapter pachys]|uniref:G-protein coupled receptors family 1 profile domain-containing protein n=1 Tax=Diploscapter pachys TaxID=2018661 RepID=A0A2A2J5E4_9BILA|nr:hypothetical protein WR25_09647 [Diploscapter pachys]